MSRMPGDGCRHHRTGRCLYEEHLNPGYAQQWRCALVVAWEKAYDEFLDRAENFHLGESDLAVLWRSRFERMVREEGGCPDFAFSPGGELPACVHAFSGLCLLRLPSCEGRCRDYSPEGQTTEPTTEEPE